MLAMTFRVYVRWPGQRVSDRTTTESRAVAEVAYGELVERSDLAAQGALGVAFTEDQRQVAYHAFNRPSEPGRQRPG